MGKVKSFAAKLAHESTNEGKVMCPVCNTEMRKIKIIGNKKSAGAWAPKYEFVTICKCNEADFMAGKR